MIFEAKNELLQYLSSINPNYAKYTEGLWANEVNSISQLGDASLTVLQSCGVENPVHAGNIIARSEAAGKCNSHSTVIQCSCAAATSLETALSYITSQSDAVPQLFRWL